VTRESEAVAPPQRRTQAQRRTATRSALLQATVDCLTERGYSGTTTLEIERRAGVSRGARIHHFPSKAELLAAAVDHLYQHLSDHYDEAFGRPSQRSDADRLRAGLRLLWSVYRGADYTAVLELNMAARTDQELRERLQSVGERHRGLAVAAADRYFPGLPPAVVEPLVEAVHTTMMGLLLQANVEERPQRDAAVLALLEEVVVGYLGTDPGAAPEEDGG